jgi:hypothetical protein
MVVPVIAETIDGLVLIAAGYYYFARARIFCERVRTYAQQTNVRWRAILCPQWFWGTERCVFQFQASGIGVIVVALYFSSLPA